MNRVKFMASGRTFDSHGQKTLEWWEARITERGYEYELNKDGRDVNIIVDDRADPFFTARKKPTD